MKQWTDLLGSLSDDQNRRIFDACTDQFAESGTVLIREGQPLDAIYFVIQGLLHVRRTAMGYRALAVLGPGEIVGEMAFLDAQVASASVVAAEDAHLAKLPHDKFEAILKQDQDLRADVYRALAVILTRRLRSMSARYRRVIWSWHSHCGRCPRCR